MIVLDTNVVSEFMKAEPNEAVVNWLHQQPSDEIWMTSITVLEIQFGLDILPEGKRKRALVQQFDLTLNHEFDHRILNFDTVAAIAAAEISAVYKRAGRGSEVRDMQIAGIVSQRGGLLATRNVKDFHMADIAVVDPWNFLAT